MLRRDFYGKSKARRLHVTDHPNSSFRTNNPFFTGFLSEILINLTNECEEKPHPAMKEECMSIYNDHIVHICHDLSKYLCFFFL